MDWIGLADVKEIGGSGEAHMSIPGQKTATELEALVSSAATIVMSVLTLGRRTTAGWISPRVANSDVFVVNGNARNLSSRIPRLY